MGKLSQDSPHDTSGQGVALMESWMTVSNEHGEKWIALREVQQVEWPGLDDGLKAENEEWEESRMMGKFLARTIS